MGRLIGIVLFGSCYMAILLGCSSMDKFDSEDREYYSYIKKYTDRAEFYQGFMNVFQMQGTILNSKVLNGQLDKKAESFKWTDSKRSEEQSKVNEGLQEEAVVFLSFYSPENKINNLESASSIWRVFLDVNNKRYIGKISTYVGFANEAQLFYPYHSVFSKAYLIKFPVPMAEIQNQKSKLTVTGTIGSDTLTFNPL